MLIRSFSPMPQLSRFSLEPEENFWVPHHWH